MFIWEDENKSQTFPFVSFRDEPFGITFFALRDVSSE